MLPPRVEVRRYTANRSDTPPATIHPTPAPAPVFIHVRDLFPSWDNMSLLEREASRDDH